MATPALAGGMAVSTSVLESPSIDQVMVTRKSIFSEIDRLDKQSKLTSAVEANLGSVCWKKRGKGAGGLVI
jgi:hypothetical protein